VGDESFLWKFQQLEKKEKENISAGISYERIHSSPSAPAVKRTRKEVPQLVLNGDKILLWMVEFSFKEL
jgi:hypothetical protein